MPYLNDELREWVGQQLATMGVDEIAVYAIDPRRGEDEERRILVATEVGLLDGWYGPRGGSSARYSYAARLWPWQAVRGVDLRSETFRVWALEHRTRWWLRVARPHFEAETESPELGGALCDLAKVCAVMAEPAGWQGGADDLPLRRESAAPGRPARPAGPTPIGARGAAHQAPPGDLAEPAAPALEQAALPVEPEPEPEPEPAASEPAPAPAEPNNGRPAATELPEGEEPVDLDPLGLKDVLQDR